MFWIVALMTLNVLQADYVDVQDRRLYLECVGTGSPTVVFVSGRTDRSDVWNKTVEGLKGITKTCVYDRPGTVTITGDKVEISRSTETKQPRSVQEGVDDLHAILQKMKGPFVLVAHSYGGLIARLYASEYPDEIVGMVLVDTLTELLYDNLQGDDKTIWVKLNSHYSTDLDAYLTQERIDLVKSLAEVRGTNTKEIPVVVLTSDETYDFKALKDQGILPQDAPTEFGKTVFKAHLKGQDELTQKLKAKHITNTHAGHYIQIEQPQLVIEAIKSVLR